MSTGRKTSDDVFAVRDCNGFRIVPVFGRVDDELAGRIVSLWRRHRILPPTADGQRRLKQVACVAFDPYGELAAVNTVYPKEFDGRCYLAYRIFIRPFNGEPGLKFEMTRVAREMLRHCDMPEHPRGLMIVVENPRLARNPEVSETLMARGYRPGGLTASGQTVWLYDF